MPWARGDVGAIATQSYANVTLRPGRPGAARRGCRRSGRRSTASSPTTPAGTSGRSGIVDAAGGSATFTGSGCFEWAGGRTGPCHAAQGNILAGPQVVDALVDTFLATDGPLVERLLAALAAADTAGGDRRGRQSACVVVRRTGGGYGGNNDILIDLRVDDHTEPVGELQRLYAIHDLLFGQTPEDRMIPLEEVRAEVTERLARLGFDGSTEEAMRAWAGRENLEERLRENRIDPVLLRALREAT